MPVCTSACTSGVTIPSLAQVCDVNTRSECPSKLVLFTCSTAIPSGNDAAKAAALDGLITSGDLGATGKLKNFVFGDPQYADVKYADCYPAQQVVSARDLTFEDYNAIDTDDVGDPAAYNDRDFWNTVIGAGQKFYFGYTTCDGLLYLFTQDRAYTTWMTAVLNAFQTDDRTVENTCVEVKKGTIRFLGDPKRYFPKPYLDLSTVVGSTPSLAALY